MTQTIRSLVLVGVVFAAPVLVGNCAKADPPVSKATASPAGTPASQAEPATRADAAFVLTDAEKQAVAGFEARVADYTALLHKLEATIPALPDKATPEEIDGHQQAMSALIRTARKDAKQGEFFTPGMQALIKRALGATLTGADDKTTKLAVMEDNPGLLDVSVNDRYPDGAPVSSMPIELLETLPKLPEGLEYRFLGKHLVLVCGAADMVLDLTPNVLP